MQHIARGKSKIVPILTLPPTSARRVNLIVTNMAVLHPTPEGLLLQERAPGVSVEDIVAATEATLLIPDDVPEMVLGIAAETAGA